MAPEQDAANAAATLPGLAGAGARRAPCAGRAARPLARSGARALALDALHLPDELPVSVPSDLLHQRPDILAAEAAVRAAADAGRRPPPPRCFPR